MMVCEFPKKILEKICSIDGVSMQDTHLLVEVGMRSFHIYSTDLNDYQFGVKSYFDVIEFAKKLSGDYGQSTSVSPDNFIKTIYFEDYEQLGVFTEVNSMSLGEELNRDFTIIETDSDRKIFPAFVFSPILEVIQTDTLQVLDSRLPELTKILKDIHEREKMAFD